MGVVYLKYELILYYTAHNGSSSNSSKQYLKQWLTFTLVIVTVAWAQRKTCARRCNYAERLSIFGFSIGFRENVHLLYEYWFQRKYQSLVLVLVSDKKSIFGFGTVFKDNVHVCFEYLFQRKCQSLLLVLIS